jgi:hypothetical protein
MTFPPSVHQCCLWHRRSGADPIEPHSDGCFPDQKLSSLCSLPLRAGCCAFATSQRRNNCVARAMVVWWMSLLIILREERGRKQTKNGWHAPTDSAHRRWGMGLRRERSTELTPKSQPNGAAGTGDVSTPIVPSAARRARPGMGVLQVGGEFPRPRHSADSLRRQSDRVRCAGDVMPRT